MKDVDAVVRAMQGSGVLEGIRAEALERFAVQGNIRNYAARTYVFHEGDAPSFVYVLLSGSVEISSSARTGQRKLHSKLGPGSVFGELGVLGAMPRTASALALDDVRAWGVEGHHFIELLRNEPDGSLALLGAMAQQLQRHEAAIEDLIYLDLKGRVARKLLELAPDEETRITPEVTQTELADMCGGSRENIARALSALQKRGIVERQGRAYALLDTAHLERLATP